MGISKMINETGVTRHMRPWKCLSQYGLWVSDFAEPKRFDTLVTRLGSVG